MTYHDTKTNLAEAVTILKASIGENTEHSRIFLYSDGCIPLSDELFPPSVETTYVRVGEPVGNLGISRFAVNTSPASASELDLFVEITARMDDPGTSTLSVELDGAVVDAESIEWEAGASVFSRALKIPALDEGLLTVRIDREDALRVDNSVAAYLYPPDPLLIEVVGDGEGPLARALNLIPESRVFLSSRETYGATVEADVVVFDGWAPEKLPDSIRSAFFVAAPSDSSAHQSLGVEWGDEVEYPIILDWNRTHPVTRGAEYRNLQVAKANTVTLPPDALTLIEARGIPLLFALEKQDRRFLFSSFDLGQSNWTRLYSFPITMTNAVRWLSDRTSSLAVTEVLETGSPLDIRSGQAGGGITIRNPMGSVSRLESRPNQRTFYSETLSTGTYEITYPDGTEKKVWFNLLDSEESQIAAKENIHFGKEQIVATESARTQKREVWKWPVLAAFMMLLVEWWFYTRQSWL